MDRELVDHIFSGLNYCTDFNKKDSTENGINLWIQFKMSFVPDFSLEICGIHLNLLCGFVKKSLGSLVGRSAVRSA